MIAGFDAIATGTDIQRRIGVKTSRDEPLARFTTMRVGGPADLFATVHNAHELRALVRFARDARARRTSSSGGGATWSSPTRAIRGLVIQVRAEGSRTDGERYTAEAGVQMARAATETQRAGLTGLEFGLAIPGTVGGAVWANAGAHEADVAGRPRVGPRPRRRRHRERSWPRPTSAWPTATAGSSTATRRSGAPRDVVIDATFRLAPADPDTIKARLDDIRHWRQAHQPLGLPSAGSVFRNPAGDSAGRLIEAAGLKGTRIGGAVVSEKHANFIVNDQKGTATDVRRLAEHVRADDPGAPRASSSPSRSSSSATGPAGRRPRDVVDARRSSSCSAGRRPSTTSRSCPGRPIAEALAGRRATTVEQVADRPRRRLVVAAGRPSARRTVRPPPTTIRPRSARTGRSPPGAAARPAGRASSRRRSCSSPSTARSARTARSRRCSRRPASPTPGSGVAASAIGMDKALFKRMCRGIGLPVVDWREVRARPLGGATRDAVRAELAAFAARRRRPAADGQAGAARQLGRDDPRPRPVRARRGARPGLPATTRSRWSRPTSPGARDLEVAIIGNDHGRLELFGPGEIVSGHEFYDYAAKYTRRPVRDARPAPRSRGDRSGRPAQDRARRVPGDRRRGLRAGRLPARRRCDRTCRRSTPSRASRRSASSRRCRPRAATRSLTCASGSWSSRSNATPARAGRPPHARGPAAMNGRPVARRTPRRPCPARRTRPVRRASAGLSAVRAGAALAMLVSAAAIYGVGASSAFDYTKLQLDGAAVHRPRRRSRPPSPRSAARTCSGCRPGRSMAALEPLPTVEPAHGRRPACRGRSAVTDRGARAGPRLAGRASAATWPTPTARCSRSLGDGTGAAGAAAGCPVVEDRRAGVGRPRGRVARSTRSTSTRRPGSPRSCRPTSAARRSRWPSRSPTRTASCSSTRPAGWSAVFGFYTPSLRTTELIPGQVRLLRSLLVGREPQVDRVILASGHGRHVRAAAPRPSRRRRPSRRKAP